MGVELILKPWHKCGVVIASNLRGRLMELNKYRKMSFPKWTTGRYRFSVYDCAKVYARYSGLSTCTSCHLWLTSLMGPPFAFALSRCHYTHRSLLLLLKNTRKFPTLREPLLLEGFQNALSSLSCFNCHPTVSNLWNLGMNGICTCVIHHANPTLYMLFPSWEDLFALLEEVIRRGGKL